MPFRRRSPRLLLRIAFFVNRWIGSAVRCSATRRRSFLPAGMPRWPSGRICSDRICPSRHLRRSMCQRMIASRSRKWDTGVRSFLRIFLARRSCWMFRSRRRPAPAAASRVCTSARTPARSCIWSSPASWCAAIAVPSTPAASAPKKA